MVAATRWFSLPCRGGFSVAVRLPCTCDRTGLGSSLGAGEGKTTAAVLIIVYVLAWSILYYKGAATILS